MILNLPQVRFLRIKRTSCEVLHKYHMSIVVLFETQKADIRTAQGLVSRLSILQLELGNHN